MREILDDYMLLLLGGSVVKDPEIADRKRRTGYYFTLGEHVGLVLGTIIVLIILAYVMVAF